MSFNKKAPKSPKATLNELLQSGAIKTGKHIANAQEVKVKQAVEFKKTIPDKLSNRPQK